VHRQPLWYPTAKLWSVSQVSPEQHSKMFDLQVTHCSCPWTTTVFRGDWHLGQRCWGALAGFKRLSMKTKLLNYASLSNTLFAPSALQDNPTHTQHTVTPLAEHSGRDEWVVEIRQKNATLPSGECFYDTPLSDFTVLNVVASLTLS